MMFSMPSWAGAAISATSFAFTAKSSTASDAAHDRRRFEIFSCTDRRSFCTFATSWTYGNGTCACSISNKGLKTILGSSAAEDLTIETTERQCCNFASGLIC
jgi:hypothetical protein